DLDCGHKQHMRHDPPWLNRTWILTAEGRAEKVGTELNCKRCDEFGMAIAEAVRTVCVELIQEAREEAGIRGLCKEGQDELVLDSLNQVKLEPIVVAAIQKRIKEDYSAPIED